MQLQRLKAPWRPEESRCDVNTTALGSDFVAAPGLLVFYGEPQIFGGGKKEMKIRL